MAKSFARRAYETAMRARLRGMFDEAGTTFEARPDGRVAVTNWPAPRVSNSTFLSDLAAEMEEQQAEPKPE